MNLILWDCKSDLMFDPNIDVGHSYLYFMVQ